MTIGTVCSGIGAPEIAFDAKPLWFSEIEKFPSAVLAHHYPDVPNLGDFTTDEAIDHMVANPPDVFVGGTPCQAFSVAGKRQSLDDDRGNLTMVFTEVWHRLRSVGTRYALWENVYGVLNTKDNAFGCFVSAMVGADTVIEPADGKWQSAGMASGPAGTIAWRVLDAQFFGVAQRRRRVFAVIGHSGDFSVAKILFEREGVFGNTAKGTETGQDATRAVGEGFTASSHACNKRGTGTLRANGGDLGGGSETLVNDWVSPQLHARDYKDCGTDGFNRERAKLVLHSQAFAQNTRDEVRFIGGDGQVAGALAAETGMKQQSYVYENHPNDSRVKGPLEVCEQLTARNGTGGGNLPLVQEAIPIHDQATRHSGKRGSNQDGKGNGLGIGKAGDPMNTMTSGDKHAVAFNWQSGGDVRHNPSASGTDALTAHQTPAIGIDSQQNARLEGIAPMPSSGNGQSSHGSVYQGMQVRRLTPVECERLQGFPDNWTRIPWKRGTLITVKEPETLGDEPELEYKEIELAKEQCPDGPRYKAIGNAMCVNVVEFIAERIKVQL